MANDLILGMVSIRHLRSGHPSLACWLANRCFISVWEGCSQREEPSLYTHSGKWQKPRKILWARGILQYAQGSAKWEADTFQRVTICPKMPFMFPNVLRMFHAWRKYPTRAPLMGGEFERPQKSQPSVESVPCRQFILLECPAPLLCQNRGWENL